MYRAKFVFGLHKETMQTEVLKIHIKTNNTTKTLHDVVTEIDVLESGQRASKFITDTTKEIEEQVSQVSHKQIQWQREPGTCQWWGDQRGPHA